MEKNAAPKKQKVNPSAIHIACPNCGAVNRVPKEKLTQHPKCGQCKHELFTGHPIDLTDQNFIHIVSKTDLPVVVDFWASWCGPCKMMAPVFEQVTNSLEPKARFAKLNTENAQNIAAQYSIRSIPTLIIFKQGQEVARQAGAMDQSSLIQFVQSYL